MAAAQFFNPWEPAPTYAAPPSDAALVQRITKLADYAARNGPQFIKVMEGKQKDNPEFSFLFGGEGYDYYRWTLYSMLQQQPAAAAAAQQPAAAAAPPAAAPAHPYALPPEVESGFSQVLEALTGSKDSIKNSQSWFMHCAPYAAGMAAMMARRVLQLSDYDRQLHVIYLANDILFKSLSQRQQPGGEAAADHVARAFLPFLGPMLAAACTAGGKTDEVKQRLGRILAFWAERQVYDPAAIASLEHTMHHGDAATALSAAYAAAAPPSQAAPAAAPQAAPLSAAAPAQAAAASAAMAAAPVEYQAAAPHAAVQYPGAVAAAWQQHPAAQPPAAAQPAAAPPHAWHIQPPPAAAYLPPGMATTPTTPPGAMPGVWPPPAMAGVPPGMYPPAHAPGGPWVASHTSPRPPYPAHPGAHPGAMPPHGMPPHAPHPPPHHPVPPSVPPPPRPVSSFNFPPGLIPQLVKEKAEHSRPYSPLSPLDIEKAGLPPPPEKDAYLSSRLDRFHAELAEYRPGMTRTDPEERRQEREHKEPEHAGRWAGPRSRRRHDDREPAADGSFSGGGLGSGSMYAGLGSNSHRPSSGSDLQGAAGDQDAPDDDMYSQYRRIRSGAYHDFIAKNIQGVAKGFGR